MRFNTFKDKDWTGHVPLPHITQQSVIWDFQTYNMKLAVYIFPVFQLHLKEPSDYPCIMTFI